MRQRRSENAVEVRAVLGEDRVTGLCRLEPGEHERGQLEIERELDVRSRVAAIEVEGPATPEKEIGDAVATLLADRAEDVDGTDKAHRDERVAHAPAVARQDGECEIELLAFEFPSTHQVLAEQLARVARCYVMELAVDEVELLLSAARERRTG